MRRAIRYGVKLGLKEAFFYNACLAVIAHLGEAYPDLVERRGFIEEVVRSEEERFSETLEKGLTLEPKHPLLRTSLAYEGMRLGELPQAIEILERVIEDDKSMRLAFPTLAMCYVQIGDRERAAAGGSEGRQDGSPCGMARLVP